MIWYKLTASGLHYTVVQKEYMTSQYYCKIRFKNSVKPHPDWVRLSDLRNCATRVEEPAKEQKPQPTGYIDVPYGWFSI